MHSDLQAYLNRAGFSRDRERRMIDGLRVLQELASRSALPITYGTFAERLQPGLAPIATAHTLEDIGQFCNAASWPNVTCFVVSAATGECSDGFTKISTERPEVARDAAWLAYAAYRNAPRVDDAGRGATRPSCAGADEEGGLSLDQQFQAACERAVDECRALGYAPAAWVGMMHGQGGAAAAAKRLLRSGDVQSGFEKLIAMGRSDLTVEHAVLEERWAELFTDAERVAARWRLEQGRTL